MFEHDLEKIGSAVSKHSENIKGFGFSAKNLAENPNKLAGFKPQEPQLFGCMVAAAEARVCDRVAALLNGDTQSVLSAELRHASTQLLICTLSHMWGAVTNEVRQANTITYLSSPLQT